MLRKDHPGLGWTLNPMKTSLKETEKKTEGHGKREADWSHA